MASQSKDNTLYTLGILPTLMGIGHLAPVIGAIYSATGSYQFPWAVLGMIGTASTLIDSHDTHKDVPLSARPREWVWKTWIYSLWTMVFFFTFFSGIHSAWEMYRFSLIGLCWGTPCVPTFSSSAGLHFFKPKTVFREGKSLVVAVCMGYVTAATSMTYFCHAKDAQCTDVSIRSRSLALAVLYHFFRETACDTRDIADDAKEGMKTLPVRLGKNGTLLFMGIMGSLLDAFITNGISPSWSGTQMDISMVLASFLRVGLLMGLYYKILQYPKENLLAWGAMSVFGVAPVVLAQASLI